MGTGGYILHSIHNIRTPAVPIDPLALTYTFAEVLYRLIPPAVRLEHRSSLVGVMGELSDIMTDTDRSLWSRSQRKCVEQMHEYFREMDLTDGQLMPKLRHLILLWKPNFDPDMPLWAQRLLI